MADAEISHLLNAADALALSVLESQRGVLDQMVEMLMDQEELEGEQLEELLRNQTVLEGSRVAEQLANFLRSGEWEGPPTSNGFSRPW